MKVKIIATGEVVDVHLIKHYTCANLKVYSEITGERTWREDEIEIINNTKHIDWEQRRFELSNSALQGMLSNPKYCEINEGGIQILRKLGKEVESTDFLGRLAVCFADSVISKLKEGQ